jgi:hypothetical protein
MDSGYAMRASLLLISSYVLCLPAVALAAEPDCQAIVAATVAEMKAGASDWDAESEALVRRSAGAACVKALSGSYGATPASTSDAPGAGVAPRAASSSQQPSASAGGGESAEQEKGGLDGLFSGFKRNEISGSPNKKPYQRKREPEQAEAEETPTE